MPRGEKLKPYQWKPGQSGNPSGLPREGKRQASLSLALKHVGIKKLKNRTVLAEIGTKLGYSEYTNIELVAALIYDSVATMMAKAIDGDVDAGNKVVGLLEIVFKGTDGNVSTTNHNTASDPNTVLAGVSAMLGFVAPRMSSNRQTNGRPTKSKTDNTV